MKIAANRNVSWALALIMLLSIAATRSPAQDQQTASNADKKSRVAKEGESKNLAVVQALIAAFNKHDAAQMKATLADNCEVYYVNKAGKAELASKSSEQLRLEMTAYFKALPNVKSKVDGSVVAGGFVSIRETVNWSKGDKKYSQFSLGVFEIAKGKIRRVWYYPAQK